MALFLAPLLLSILPVDGAERLDLDDYVSQVVAANPNLQAAQARAEAMGFRVKPASSLDDPFFAVGPDEIPFDGGGSVIRYQVNQIIPYPGKPFARGRAAKARALAAESDTETTRRQIVVFATQAFYKAYYNQEEIRLNKETRDLLGPLLETSKSKYETGGTTHHEWLLAKAQLGILETERLKLLRERTALDALLNELRNRESDAPIGGLAANFSSNARFDDAEFEKEIQNQPELQSLQRLADASHEEKRLAKLNFIPDFMVQGMVAQSRMEAEPSRWGVMVGLNLPVFGYRKQANLARAAGREQEVALAEKQGIENKLKTELTEARQQYKTAGDIAKLYKDTVIPETRLALKSVRDAYTAGAAPLTSVLNFSMIRLTQELEYLAARIDVELAKVRKKELLSSPPIERFTPSSPTLFTTDAMGGMGTAAGMRTPTDSAAGMGRGGMSGPAAKPQQMGKEKDSKGMGGMP